MSHRRLLGFSATAYGLLRRSHSTAASDSRGGWSWYMLEKTTMAVEWATGPSVRFADPPRVSELYMPESLFNPGSIPVPDRESDVMRILSGQAASASQDGLLLLNYQDIRIMAPIVGMERQGTRVRAFRRPTGLPDPSQVPDMAHFVFNPFTREISARLPDIQGAMKIRDGFQGGLLTQADAGRGPPDRYAVAKLEGHAMLRFLSETGEWETVQGSQCQLLPPAGRRFSPCQEVVAFGGQLWWVDVTWDAICADPFSDRPEPRFVELPSGSVLPADASEQAINSSIFLPDAEGEGKVTLSMRMPNMCRRVGVSGGCLRYVEVSQEEPFMLSSFALDGSHSGWTLEHRVALSRLWVNGTHPWLPLQGENRPQIGVLDPYEANVVHLVVGKHVVAVDMDKGEVTEHVPYRGHRAGSILPCVVSPWLPTTRIPSAGKKDVSKKTTLADVLVPSDRYPKN